MSIFRTIVIAVCITVIWNIFGNALRLTGVELALGFLATYFLVLVTIEQSAARNAEVMSKETCDK